MMREIDLQLTGCDDNSIFCTLCQPTVKSGKVIVHLHGMTHSLNTLLEVTSAPWFVEKGYDHLRCSFYDRRPGSRRLPDSTLSTHVNDLEKILAYAHEHYDEVYLVAHSLSCLVSLIANPSLVKAMVFWDPALDVSHFWNVAQCMSQQADGSWLMDYGNVFKVGDAMVQEIAQYPDAVCRQLAEHVSTPTRFVIPEESIFLASPHTSPDVYSEVWGGGHDVVRMSAANHTFSKLGNAQVLFEHTLDWLSRY